MRRCDTCGSVIRGPEPKGLTARQREALTMIAAFIAAHGHAPSFREIQAALKRKSVGHVHAIVCALEKRGWLARWPGANRSIALTRAGYIALEIERLRQGPDIIAAA